MSVGPTGMAGSFAATAQSRGNEVERSQQDDAVQRRKADVDRQAESAEGVGETSEDQETSERDADGRRLWEKPPAAEANDQDDNAQVPASKDATGARGANLDLSG